MRLTPDEQAALEMRRYVLEQTNDGLDILQVLIDTFEDKIEGMTLNDRVSAASEIIVRTIQFSLEEPGQPESAMEVVLVSNLNLFRRVARFLVEVVEGRHVGLTPRQRVILSDYVRDYRKRVDCYGTDGELSQILNRETDNSKRLRDFLWQVVTGDVEGATPADVHSALKLLTS